MKIRYLLMLFFVGISFLKCKPENKAAVQEKPNILFILVDDLGWKDVGYMGSAFYETPNIDKLAAKSLVFTNAYASSPLCSPTRSSIMTGKHPVKTDITDWIPGRQNTHPGETFRKLQPQPFQQFLPLQETTIAEELKKEGYITHISGKWHLGDSIFYPENQGFDSHYGEYHQGWPGWNGYFYPFKVNNVPGKEGDYLTNRLTSLTIDFIRKNRDTSFFAYLPFYAVHTPIMAPDSLVRKYENKKNSLGYAESERFRKNEEWAKNLPQEKYPNHTRIVQDNPVYAAMIEIVDHNIGRLVQILQECGIDKKTVIVFTSDNGGLSRGGGAVTSNLPLRAGKGWLYEGGIRVPAFIYFPGSPALGAKTDEVIVSADFFPTLLSMANRKTDKLHDGMNLLPLTDGQPIPERNVFWHYPHYSNLGSAPSGAIRSGKYKLIQFFEDNSVELYNLENDIGESTNLAKQFPDVTQDLLEKLKRWQQENKAKIPCHNPIYKKIK